ncbi:MAG: OadG family protein [bacterium]|nr:OadG family protein [bacterium]
MLLMGFSYMLVGMTVVFSFLILQVILMKVMSNFVLRYFPEKEELIKAPSPVCRDRDIIALITAAVRNYEAGSE